MYDGNLAEIEAEKAWDLALAYVDCYSFGTINVWVNQRTLTPEEREKLVEVYMEDFKIKSERS